MIFPKDNDELRPCIICPDCVEEPCRPNTKDYCKLCSDISTHVLRAREAEIELMLSEEEQARWDYELELMLRKRLAHLNSQRKGNK